MTSVSPRSPVVRRRPSRFAAVELLAAITVVLGLVLALPTSAMEGNGEPAPGPSAGETDAVDVVISEPVGRWTTALTAESGAQPYCATERRFDNGLSLLFVRNLGGLTNMLVGVPEAAMYPGETFELSLSVDDGGVETVTAVAQEADLLVIPLGRETALLDRVARGYRLRIDGPNDSVILGLEGSANALRALGACVDDARAREGEAQGSADPEQQQGTTRDTLPRSLASLLRAAGASGIQPVSLNGTGGAPSGLDFAWTAGPLLGGVIEGLIDPGASAEDVLAAHAVQRERRCPGRFDAAQALAPTRGDTVIAVADMRCLAEGLDVVASVIAYVRRGVSTVIFHEADVADWDMAASVRDGLTETVRQRSAEGLPTAIGGGQ